MPNYGPFRVRAEEQEILGLEPRVCIKENLIKCTYRIRTLHLADSEDPMYMYLYKRYSMRVLARGRETTCL